MPNVLDGNDYPAGTHIQIHDVKIIMSKETKPSKTLDVLVNGKEQSTSWSGIDSTGETHQWAFKHDCLAFPDSKVQITPFHSRASHMHLIHRDKIDVFELSVKDLVEFCLTGSDDGQSESAEYSTKGEHSKLVLKITLKGFSGIKQELTKATNAKQPEDIDVLAGLFKQVSLGESWMDGISQLRSVLEPIANNMDIVQKLEEGLETLASVHPIAKAAIVALMIPFNMMKKELDFVNDLKGLANEMKELLSCVTDARFAAKISSAAKSVADIIKTILEASQYINDYMGKGAFKRFTAAQFRTSLDGYKSKFVSLRESFRDTMIVQIAVNVDELQNDATNSLLRDRLAPAHQEAISGGCLEGTRVSVLKAVGDWLNNPNAPNILWISGAPGAGKSAISSSVVRSILNYRCAKFFFKKEVVSLRDPRRVWRTVALELADMYHSVKTDILDLLSTDRKYPQDADVKDQFRELIKGPLLKLHGAHFQNSSTGPPVVVIDALDECTPDKDADMRELLASLVEWGTLPSTFKLLITSRDESDIRKSLSSVSLPIAVQTGSDVTEESTSDIRRFFQSRFQELNNSDATWPGANIIEQLTQYAAGLFIWANTAADFVGQRKGDPVRRLKTLLGNMGKQSDVIKIDRLYGQILVQTFAGLQPDEHDDMIMVLAAVVFAKDALQVSELVEFLASEGIRSLDDWHSSIQLAIDNLRPIISVHDTDQMIHTCHKTFSDFIVDEARVRSSIKTFVDPESSADLGFDSNTFTLDRSKQNALILHTCLQLMNGKLAFNICNLSTSSVSNRDVKDLDTLVAEHVGRALTYACRHWAEHLADVSENDPMLPILRPLLTQFMFEHALHWMEVLSLTKSVHCAVPTLNTAAMCTKNLDKDLSELCQDASRFVTKFQPVITDSAPHIYISALPFAPTSSKITKVFGPKFENILSVLSGRRKNWDQMLMTLEGHSDRVTCMSFRAGGKQLISGSLDKLVRIWDADTGFPVGDPITGHSDSILSLAITKDGKLLATGCRDGTLRIWDLDAGRCTLGPINAHRFKLASLTFLSQERLASGSGDGTVNIWDISQGGIKSCFGPLKGHKGAVFTVAASPEGLRLVSGSLDKSLIIWDTQNGSAIGQPLLGHTGAVSSVAYSSDGKYIASGSDDSTIRLWDSEGKPSAKPLKGHKDAVFAATFSSNDKLVISGSRDGTIRFWDRNSGDQVQVGEPMPRLAGVHAVAFSPQRAIVASGHDDAIIRVWDAGQRSEATSIDQGHEVAVMSVAFDADGKRLVSGSKDGHVRIWDVGSGDCLAKYAAKTPGAAFVGFVPEGDRVAVGEIDGTIELICPKSGEILQSIPSAQPEIMSMAISPKNKHVASGSRGTILLWDYSTCTRVGQFQGHEGNVLTIAFSPDGSVIASGSDDQTIRLWKTSTADADDASAYAVLRGHKAPVFTVGFNREGTRLGSGCFDDTVGIWDVSSESPSNLSLGVAHTQAVKPLAIYSLAFSPNAPAFATGGGNVTLKLWNAEKGETIGFPVVAHTAPIYTIAFSPDGKHIATGSADAAVKIWEIVEKDGMPLPMSENNVTEDPSSIYRVTFSKDDHKRITETLTSANASHFGFFDCMDNPVVGDWSHVGLDGWVRNLGKLDEGKPPQVFWLHAENHTGFWMPRNSAVMSRCTTRIDFSRFVYGENWQKCRTGSANPQV